eukprot:snap_masked-scaffold871_size86487-processed-gene-0.14 protein:Tk08318 transcript:snap_masked-scaffold871_size86487-processed-gene-0.14-mRNA-1 annotation:"conserved hypothetical protein"
MDPPPAELQSGDAFEWTPDALEHLRLCRNRAYAKVNNKKRQHLPASMSGYLQREWMTSYPGGIKLSGKLLLDVYQAHYEQPEKDKRRRVHPGRGRRRGGGAAGARSSPAPVSTISRVPVEGLDGPMPDEQEDHSDKQWSEAMLENLLACGERANEKLEEGSPADMSLLLSEEWKRINPNSSLSGRSLKARLTVYQGTRSEQPPSPKKRRMEDEDSLSSDLPMAAESSYSTDTLNGGETHVVPASGNGMEDIQDEFAPSEASSSSAPIPSEAKMCKKHIIHMFKDSDDSISCILTEQMLQIRRGLKPSFPGCDLHHPKKPKGFSGMMLKEWKGYYPKSDENIKSVTVKFSKYDTAAFELRKTVTSGEDGSIDWTQEMLENLKMTRDYAENKCGLDATSHMITRHWKKEWKSIYPHLDADWRTIVHKYQTKFGSFTTPQTEGGHRSGFSVSNSRTSAKVEDIDEKVKGFRNWTSRAKQDLLRTKNRVVQEHPGVEPGCSQFNRLLLQAFTKIHPKCMESARSIFSKVQSIEKEEATHPGSLQSAAQADIQVNNLVSSFPGPDGDEGECSHFNLSDRLSESVFAGDDQSRGVCSNDKENEVDSQLNRRIAQEKLEDQHSEEDKGDEGSRLVKANEETSGIEGFEGWTLHMIRDFIACMDTARRKYAILKENDPDGSIKLVPLLLEEWKRIHQDSPETVGSFLVKIKHLKSQKDVIKKHLGQSGLLPKVENGGGSQSKSVTHFRSGPNGEFKWNKEMIDDVIQARKKALASKNEAAAQGMKLSFHQLWSDEFKKIYPNSTFTSNNLSVHFWSWRKQQQRLGKVDPLYDEKLSLADSSRPMPSNGAKLAPLPSHWSAEELTELLELGKSLQLRMRASDASNIMKSKGFPALLHSEWRRKHPGVVESPRALNQLFQGLTKQAGKISQHRQSKTVAKTKWKPKFNSALRQCIQLLDPENPSFVASVMENWRSTFPHATINDEDLFQRIKDITPTNCSEIPSRLMSRSSSVDGPLGLDHIRAPNARGQMCWNKQTIRDLFQAHQMGLHRRKELLQSMSKKDAPLLSSLVLEEFLKLHPYCKLSPSILMAKCYCWKNAVNKGTLDIHVDDPEASKVIRMGDSEREMEYPIQRTGRSEIESSERIENNSSHIAYRSWTKDKIDDLLKTRKKAQGLKKLGEMRSVLDIWYSEFSQLYPNFSCTKKNLLRKFKWYRSRVARGEATRGHIKEALQAAEDAKGHSHAMAIRKDVALHIKKLMEEARIFLPTKLPKEAELKRAGFYKYTMAGGKGLTSTTSLAAIPLSSLASQSGANGGPVVLSPGAIYLPPGSLQSPGISVQKSPPTTTTVVSTAYSKSSMTSTEDDTCSMAQESEGTSRPVAQESVKGAPESQCKSDTIKLPGGATLVAVTDRNLDGILKPKPVEKPNVTITIGEKRLEGSHESSVDEQAPPTSEVPSLRMTQANLRQPIILPINVPKFSISNGIKPGGPTIYSSLRPVKLGPGQNSPILRQPLTLVPFSNMNGILPQLASLNQKAIITPIRVKARLEELEMTEVQFHELLPIYDKARHEYIETLKRGYLAFFPFILGSMWKQKHPNHIVAGRKLTIVVEMYIEERSKGEIHTPEYLTKNPCHFKMTEQVLRQILTLFNECERDLEEDESEAPEEAMVYAELCQRWMSRYPNMKLTNKQLVSIHQLLGFDPQRSEATPETICTLVDIWRTIEKHEAKSEAFESECMDDDEAPSRLGDEDDLLTYDPDTLSIDQKQEWLIETQALREARDHPGPRPRFVGKNVRLYWTQTRIQALSLCRLRAIHRFRGYPRRKRHQTSIRDLMVAEFRHMYPDCELSAAQIVGKCAREIRVAKKAEKRDLDMIIDYWAQECDEFAQNEDLIEVIESAGMDNSCFDMDDDLSGGQFVQEINGKLTSLSKISSLKLAGNVTRNFNNDEDVLDYIKEVQNLGKGGHAITWTPDVIRDLMKARGNAREQKRSWEQWATKEYGGVGYAYNNPEVKFKKVDDMFLEEWRKLRPNFAHLSIWTLVAYARKYDNLKKQLILDNNQGDLHSSSSSPTPQALKYSAVFFKDSLVPKFDLAILERLPEIDERTKDLFRTRQLAKEKEESEEFKFTLPFLWGDEWRKLHPESPESGLKLQRELYCWESHDQNLDLLKPALLKSEPTLDESSGCLFQPGDLPRVLPRYPVYPELVGQNHFNIECRTKAPHDPKSRLPQEECLVRFHRDIFMEIHHHLDLPAVERMEVEKDDHDTKEDEMLIHPRRRPVDSQALAPLHHEDPLQCPTCGARYDNANNTFYHLQMHQNQYEQGSLAA